MNRSPLAAFLCFGLLTLVLSSCTPFPDHDPHPFHPESQQAQPVPLPEPQLSRSKLPTPDPKADTLPPNEKPPQAATPATPAAPTAPPAQTKKPAAPTAPISKPAPRVQVKKKQPPAPVKTVKTITNRNKTLTLAQLVQKYPELLVLNGHGSSKHVALTFDDAPDKQFTPQVLDILKEYNVHATFFLIGAQAEKYPDIVKRIVKEGHVIGNHSYNHKLFTKLSDETFKDQVLLTQQSLKSLIGYTPRLLRPPFGEISESQLLWATGQGYRIVNWNVDSLDWKQLQRDQVIKNIVDHTKAGAIILQHSGGGPGQNLSGSVEALPTVIKTLQSRGYKLVTLPEMLQVSKSK